MIVTLVGKEELDEEPPEAETAFLRIRPAAVGLDAPRMERGSDGPACEADDDIREDDVSCDNRERVRNCVSLLFSSFEKGGR